MLMISVALLLFSSISAAVGILTCQLTGTLTSFNAAFTFAVGALVTAVILRRKIPELRLPEFGFLEYAMSFCFVLFCFRQFFWIYYFREGHALTLNTNNFGDLPLHLNYIAEMVRGAKFWPVNPIFPYEKLHYPIGVDFLTACFVK